MSVYDKTHYNKKKLKKKKENPYNANTMFWYENSVLKTAWKSLFKTGEYAFLYYDIQIYPQDIFYVCPPILNQTRNSMYTMSPTSTVCHFQMLHFPITG